jgi:hypothetical protein
MLAERRRVAIPQRHRARNGGRSLLVIALIGLGAAISLRTWGSIALLLSFCANMILCFALLTRARG